MANISIDAIDGLSAREIMHAQTSALPSRTTVAEARAYFAASSSRRLAVLADDGRYVGALTAADLTEAADPTRTALDIAVPRSTVAADAPAAIARDLALATATRRVPVLDGDGRFVGIVSVNRTAEWFCGTS